MDIGRAKEQIKNTIRVYLLKNQAGQYCLPIMHQRPVFLLGAPGLGKTAIMQQIADEMGIGLVSYSMTHHTRQSALGLPVIVEKEFEGKTYTVSEYTMSEIIASVYECMKKTGKKEGILFLDEINCVSETLSPSMLLFLQYKVFGGHQVPEGWAIVTAGNPARFNKSVREFDAATRDRLKVIEIEPDYEAWKKYALEQGISRSVVSYLDIRQDDFYRAETTVDGMMVVTPRSWEDLSEMIQYYEKLQMRVGLELTSQYLQSSQIARDFSVYYELYQKYRQVYQIGELLQGNWTEDTLKRAGEAKMDERMSLVSLLLEGVFGEMKKCMRGHDALAIAAAKLRERKTAISQAGEALEALLSLEKEWEAQFQNARKKDMEIYMELMEITAKWHEKLGNNTPQNKVSKEDISGEEDLKEEAARKEAPYTFIVRCYKSSVEELTKEVRRTQEMVGNMLKFLQEAFGKGTELGMAVNDLTVVPEAAAFIGQFLSEEYFAVSRDMLLHRQEEQLIKQIDALQLSYV